MVEILVSVLVVLNNNCSPSTNAAPNVQETSPGPNKKSLNHQGKVNPQLRKSLNNLVFT